MYSYLAITPHIDLALISLYLFWAFFAGLIYYLHREGKREGYPLLEDGGGRGVSIVGFPGVPEPKTYRLQEGGTSLLPSGKHDAREHKLVRTAGFAGAPYAPTGDPMAAGVGPGAWAERSDHPDLTVDGEPKIVPLAAAAGFHLADGDPDPRGWPVIGGDNKVAGAVKDIWVDKSEYMMRYFEIELPGGKSVLAPTTFCKVKKHSKMAAGAHGAGRIVIKALYADNFPGVPGVKTPGQVSLLEEDKICAYYGGGTLYAHPGRAEALL